MWQCWLVDYYRSRPSTLGGLWHYANQRWFIAYCFGRSGGSKSLYFVVVYTIVFGSGIYYTLKLINKGPVFIDTPNMEAGGVGHFKTPMRPLSAVDENIDSKQNSGENRHD